MSSLFNPNGVKSTFIAIDLHPSRLADISSQFCPNNCTRSQPSSLPLIATSRISSTWFVWGSQIISDLPLKDQTIDKPKFDSFSSSANVNLKPIGRSSSSPTLGQAQNHAPFFVNKDFQGNQPAYRNTSNSVGFASLPGRI